MENNGPRVPPDNRGIGHSLKYTEAFVRGGGGVVKRLGHRGKKVIGGGGTGSQWLDWCSKTIRGGMGGRKRLKYQMETGEHCHYGRGRKWKILLVLNPLGELKEHLSPLGKS